MPALHRYSAQVALPTMPANTTVHGIRLAADDKRAVRLTEVRLNGPNLTGLPNAPKIRFMTGETLLRHGHTAPDGSAAVPVAVGITPATAVVQRAMSGTANGTFIGGADITASTAGATSTHVLVEAAAPNVAAGLTLDVLVQTLGSALTTPTLTVFWEE
jgi:hypothetical protein